MEVVLHVNYKRSPEKYEDNSGTEKTTLKKFRKGNKQTKNHLSCDKWFLFFIV